MTIRTRFAPSPTGYLHVGGARTALFSWLFARKHGGTFVLRIEDTDLERSTAESVNAILEGMTWLGLEYDEGPFYQTHRFDRYRALIQQLLDEDQAYHCYCSKAELDAMREAQIARKEKPRYDGRCRHRTAPLDGVSPVVRFRNPDTGSVIIEDLVKGTIVVRNSELDDLIIARSDGSPTYNFTVVVDDLDMGITDVVRGDDHVNNTPRQINIYRALGKPVPNFAHLPMILDEQGAKLSKRTGAADVMQYRDAGYLPHALLNYLVRLGWSHGDQEIFSIAQMQSLFDLKDVNAKASRLDAAKLGWMNQQYLKGDDPGAVAKHLEWHLQQAGYELAHGPKAADLVVALRERCQTLKEMAEKSAVWFGPLTQYDEAAVAKHLNAAAEAPLRQSRERLAALGEWTPESVSVALHAAAEALGLGMGKVAQPLRVAITGTQVSPDISHTVYLAGQGEALKRIDAAIARIPGA